MTRDIESKTTCLLELEEENQQFKDQLTILNKEKKAQEKLIDNLKKKTL